MMASATRGSGFEEVTGDERASVADSRPIKLSLRPLRTARQIKDGAAHRHVGFEDCRQKLAVAAADIEKSGNLREIVSREHAWNYDAGEARHRLVEYPDDFGIPPHQCKTV